VKSISSPAPISKTPALQTTGFFIERVVLNAVFVPEPSSAALLGLGGLALMLRRKRSAA
jgi:hypothetical protein